MKTPEQIAAEIASNVEAYSNSAEEVGHPEGQPIIETFPALRELLVNTIKADREQR